MHKVVAMRLSHSFEPCEGSITQGADVNLPCDDRYVVDNPARQTKDVGFVGIYHNLLDLLGWEHFELRYNGLWLSNMSLDDMCFLSNNNLLVRLLSMGLVVEILKEALMRISVGFQLCFEALLQGRDLGEHC